MTLFSNILSTVHEAVRQHVERENPGYHVTEIQDSSETHYTETLASLRRRGKIVSPESIEVNPNAEPEYMLAYTEPSFLVEAVHATNGMRFLCTVHETDDRALLIIHAQSWMETRENA